MTFLDSELVFNFYSDIIEYSSGKIYKNSDTDTSDVLVNLYTLLLLHNKGYIKLHTFYYTKLNYALYYFYD